MNATSKRFCCPKRYLAPMATLALACLLSPGLGAQLPDIFTETIDVRVVNIEVVVTDKKGNRVTGLGIDDFELRVDGEEVPIGYFTEVREGRAAEVGDGEVGGAPGLEQGEALRTNYLIFVDDYFSITRDRNRVLDAIAEDLGELSDGDRVAMVGFDGKRIDMLTSWTRDPAKLQSAFAEARGRKAHGLQHITQLRTADEDRLDRRRLRLNSLAFSGVEEGLLPDESYPERDLAARIDKQIERGVLAAVSAMRSFGTPEGRKVLLLLTGGWPQYTLQYVLNDDLDPRNFRDRDTNLQGENFDALVDTANLLGYTIYPVDVPGFNRAITNGAETIVARSDDPSAGSLGPQFSNPRESFGSPREEKIHDGLIRLARDTGGEPMLNAMRDRSLSEVVEDTRTFYWLGFSPQRKDDDERHDIDIRIRDRKDLVVRARDGYVDLSRSTEVTMIVEGSLLFGDPPSDIPLDLRFGRPKRGGRGKMRIPLEVGMPMNQVTLLPTNGRYVNELEIRITVMDANGNRSETKIDKIAINGGAPPRPGQLYWYETDILIRKREHRIVVAVYDPLSQVIMSSTGDVAP